MAYRENKAVRGRVLVPLTLTFLVLLVIFIFSGYKIRQTAMTHAVEHRYNGVRTLFGEMIQQRTDLLVSTLRFITSQPQFARLMQEGDREALFSVTRPLLDELTPGHGISHFYFHRTDGRNFLRVHKPESFGDLIDRSTMIDSRRSGKLTHGVELGVFGTYTLRVVTPWYYKNQLIGYVELGEEIESVLRNLKKITETDFLITVDKKFLDKDLWEEGARMMKRGLNWNLLDNKVVISQTLNGIPHSIEKQLHWQYRQDPHLHRETTFDNRVFQLKSFPLMDTTKKIIGDFVILIDSSQQQAEFFKFMSRIILLSMFLCSALFAFAYKILGRVDLDLAKTRKQLFGQIDKANDINKLLHQENIERRKAEEELKLLNDELEKRVVDRTHRLEKLNCEIEAHRKELEVAYDDLKTQQTTILHQEKMAGIGQLAAGVAHDINNPIGFVANNLSELAIYTKDMRSYIELQEQALNSAEVSPEVLDELAKIRQDLKMDYIFEDLEDILKESLEGAQRVSKIVRNLRSFSRLDNDDLDMADLEECLDSTINITANELRYKAEVVKEYGNIPPLNCFPGQLNQVFMNLLINAAHSMQDYGSITVKTWEEDAFACISIADTGSGMPADVKERIFEPFFTTKPVGSGTGLGLSITYDIVKKHKGLISVESEEGKGTTFVIKLPYKVEYDI